MSDEGHGGSGGNEGRLRGLLIPVVGVPEVEGELGEGQDTEAGVEGRWGDGNTSVGDGLTGVVIEQAVESHGGDGTMYPGEARRGGRGGA